MKRTAEEFRPKPTVFLLAGIDLGSSKYISVIITDTTYNFDEGDANLQEILFPSLGAIIYCRKQRNIWDKLERLYSKLHNTHLIILFIHFNTI